MYLQKSYLYKMRSTSNVVVILEKSTALLLEKSSRICHQQLE